MHARVWRRPRRALRALLPVVVVFGVWDTVAIALGHWWFNPRSTTGDELPPGLPVEEIAWLSMVVIFVFMIPVDGWMSKVPNPIVIYDPDVLSGVRFPIDIPLEEFVYAFAMVTLAIALWERAGRRSHPAAVGRRT